MRRAERVANVAILPGYAAVSCSMMSLSVMYVFEPAALHLRDSHAGNMLLRPLCLAWVAEGIPCDRGAMEGCDEEALLRATGLPRRAWGVLRFLRAPLILPGAHCFPTWLPGG